MNNKGNKQTNQETDLKRHGLLILEHSKYREYLENRLSAHVFWRKNGECQRQSANPEKYSSHNVTK